MFAEYREAKSGHFPLKRKIAAFQNIYCVAVSQTFLKTAVLSVLRTLSYYSRTKVLNIRQLVRILFSVRFGEPKVYATSYSIFGD